MKYGPAALFEDYLAYWAETHNVRKMRREHMVRSPKLTPERAQALTELEDWCATEGVDPRRWLAALFYARRFMYAPRWDQLCGGVASRKVYDEMGSLPLYEQRIRIEPAVGPALGENPNRDVVPAAEIQKQSYANRSAALECMGALAYTFGWHPKSGVCQKCPEAARCREQLRRSANFDIVGLREGRVSWEQVVQQLAMIGDRNGEPSAG